MYPAIPFFFLTFPAQINCLMYLIFIPIYTYTYIYRYITDNKNVIVKE